MKGLILSLFLFTVSLLAGAQVTFRTVAPQVPVIAGESFEVQFIIEGDENIETFTAPSFPGFRFVTGPHIYKGSLINLNIARPLVNTVYTLAAVKPGRYLIHGAKAIMNGSERISNDVFIEVISKEEAFKQNKRKDGSFYSNSEYFLRPGENPIEKMRQNLFLKVMVDKRNCYVGEPVVATYKLYSRLESQSDIVKNPGFYGFAVYDMINLSDKAQTTEIINGKTFDVHTVRKVQLYPLQAGHYVIDPMELSNRVEFSRSEVNKKTEQQIVEGVLHNAAAELHNNTEMYESTSATESIPIHVKALPAKNKTDSFTAAVGDFSITAKLEKKDIARNEQSQLVISIKGKGNFTQIVPPVIKWPAGIDAFEPVIKDSIDRLQVPLAGTKTFRYAFVSGKPGNYEIPAVEFNFFNPDTNHFENLVTEPLAVHISNKETEKQIINDKGKSIAVSPNLYRWLTVGILLMVAILLFLIWTNKKNRKKAEQLIKEEIKPAEPGISIDKILEAAQMMMVADNNNFYRELSKSIWEYFRRKMQVSGSTMSKPLLIQNLKSAGIENAIIIDLVTIMNQCETVMYTDSIPENQKEELFTKTKSLLKSIEQKM
ncbi:MAG: BatD family protein [Bacteroidota bacterium]